jgi:hypothetical protein
MKVAALALAVLVAHGGTAVQRSDHRAELDGFSPKVAGVTARLVDDGTRIELDADGHEVVVLGYEGEPYLLVDEGGVYENALSPSTYLNRSLTGDAIPAEADSDSEPRWEKLDDGTVVRWHDHALHVPPGQALGTRDESRWSIPLRIDGEEVLLDGRLVTLPKPSMAPWLLAAAAIAIAVIVTARRGGTGTTMALLAALVAVDAARIYGIAFGTPAWLASPVDVLSDQWALLIVGWGMAIAAFVLYGRGRRWDATAAALVASAVITVEGGILELDDLASAGLTSALPVGVARAAIAIVLGLGVGLTIRAGLSLRRATSRPAPPAPRSGTSPTPGDDTQTAWPSDPASG